MASTLFQSQPDPISSSKRLESVFGSHLLDTPAEVEFDDLTRMAALVVDAPFAFATVVDDARSYWKSSFGLPAESPCENTVEESFCQYVVRSGGAIVIADAANHELTKNNPSVASMGVRAWAGVPLLAPGGQVLGSFCVVDTVPREWTEREVEIIQTLANAAAREIALRASLASERDLRERAELLAHMVQQSLLPPALPEIPGIDIASRYHPAGFGTQLAGDFYDVFAIGENRYSFVIGDVCGKGLEAAKVATLARHTVEAVATRTPAPRDVLGWLNETLIARSRATSIFITAVYGTFEASADGCRVRLACAGHPAPIVQRADGTAEAIDAAGPLLGVLADFSIGEFEYHLGPHESLIVFTDGVDEARCGSMIYSTQRLLDIVRGTNPDSPASFLASRIENDVIAFSGGVANDDIAILIVKPAKRAATA